MVDDGYLYTIYIDEIPLEIEISDVDEDDASNDE